MGSISAGSGRLGAGDRALRDLRAISEPRLAKHLDALYPSFDELFTASDAVKSLVAHPGWIHVVRLLEAERASLDSHMDGRLLESKAEYAFAHGRRGGLRALEDAAAVIVRRAELKLEEQRAKHEAEDGRAVTAGGS